MMPTNDGCFADMAIHEALNQLQISKSVMAVTAAS
jgi:hypothetical protein